VEITHVHPTSDADEADETTRPSGLSDLVEPDQRDSIDLGRLAAGLSDESREDVTGEKLSLDLDAGVLDAEDLLASGVDRLTSTRRPSIRRAPTPPALLPDDGPDLASFADPPDLPEMARATSGELDSPAGNGLDEIDAALASLELDDSPAPPAPVPADEPAGAAGAASDDDGIDIDLDDAESEDAAPGRADEAEELDDLRTTVEKRAYPEIEVTADPDGFSILPPEVVDPNAPEPTGTGDDDRPRKKGLLKRLFRKKE
jgi:hypothetical protein